MGNKSAKEYYYQYLSPNDYEKSWERHVYEENNEKLIGIPPDRKQEYIDDVLNHAQLRSNSYLIEAIVNYLVEKSSIPQNYKCIIDDMFVVMNNSLKPNSWIESEPDKYDGHIIFINRGLADGLFVYSQVYSNYCIEQEAAKQNSTDHFKTLKIRDEGISKYKTLQDAWLKLGNNLSLQKHLFIKCPYPKLATLKSRSTTQFILGHEIAHALLESGIKCDIVESYYSSFLKHENLTDEQKIELKCDLLSILLWTDYFNSNNTDGGYFLSIIEGALLTITFLFDLGMTPGQFSKTKNLRKQKIHLCIRLMHEFIPQEIYEEFYTDFFNFRDLVKKQFI